jgi:hypothetical protein
MVCLPEQSEMYEGGLERGMSSKLAKLHYLKLEQRLSGSFEAGGGSILLNHDSFDSSKQVLHDGVPCGRIGCVSSQAENSNL